MSGRETAGAEPADLFEDADHDRFTAWLRERFEPAWTEATEHRFTTELGDGELDDDAMRRYLVADYRFVETLSSTIGYAAAQAPTTDAKATLAEFLATIATDETDYFQRAFDALDVPEADRGGPPQADAAVQFDDLLRRAGREGGYAETLAVFVPAEWVYLTWATRAAEGERPERFYLDEWIDLHAGEEFRETVAWLREQLDSVGPELGPERQRRVARHFERAVALEVAFFDAAHGSRK